MSAEPSLAGLVAEYVAFGTHRAGTPSEAPTADWFAQHLRAAGFATEQHRFPIRTILEPGGRLTATGVSADVFPQWLPPADALGTAVEAPFLPLSADPIGPSIRLLTTPAPLSGNWSPAQNALVAEAAGKGAAALVLAPDEPSGELYVSNQHSDVPLPIPVVLLARNALPAFADAATRGDSARLSINGTLTDTTSINVIGRKAGRGKTIVISTPLTGWFHCGGERGPGIAVLLRTAHRLSTLDNPVIAIGTGCHEIAHLGMAHLLASPDAPPPADVALWVHFGASLAAMNLDATYATASTHLVIGTPVTEHVAKSILVPLATRYSKGSPRSPGESGQIIAAGHQHFIGLVGTFPTFHTPADKGEAIDCGRLERIAEVGMEVIQAV